MNIRTLSPLLYLFLASSTFAQSSTVVDVVPFGEGCACVLRLPEVAKDPSRFSQIIFWSALSSDSAMMQLDGQMRSLKRLKGDAEKNLEFTKYENDDYLVSINFKPAPSTCPKEKVESGDECEYNDIYGDIEIQRKSDHHVLKVKSVGTCGC